MVRWITHAQSMLPNNAMPNTNLTPDQADEVAQYLSTLR
jgi:cytochrome c1